MLYQISNQYSDGSVEDFISSSPNNTYSNISNTMVTPFKYHTNSPLKSGILTIQGKKYITPGWIPCHPETTLNDVIWTSPIKPIKVQVVSEWKFSSKSGSGEYIVKQKGDIYTCNCRGFFMAKDRNKGCTHVQQVKLK